MSWKDRTPFITKPEQMLFQAERQEILDKLDKRYKIANQNIWLYIISLAQAEQPFFHEEAMQIAEAYETWYELFPMAPVPVSELLKIIGRRKIADDPLIKKLAFNYLEGIKGKEKKREAFRELKKKFPREFEILQTPQNPGESIDFKDVAPYMLAVAEINTNPIYSDVFTVVNRDFSYLSYDRLLLAGSETATVDGKKISKEFYLPNQAGKSYLRTFTEYNTSNLPQVLAIGEVIEAAPNMHLSPKIVNI